MHNFNVHRVICDICSSMEGSSNPPKLRRNSSAAANISNLASSSNQGYYICISTKKFKTITLCSFRRVTNI